MVVIDIRKVNDTRKELSEYNSWYRLDNAAKIYPAIQNSTWAAMFRVSVTLKHKIDKDLLKIALNKTLKRFPSIAVRIRKGFFWYFLENNNNTPLVQEDVVNPCIRMKKNENRGFLFRVRYYNNRIALEIFHVLTDGTGALVFLKTLTAEYLKLLGYKITPSKGVLDVDEDPSIEEIEDGYGKFSVSKVKASRREEKAYHIKGTIEPKNIIHITSGTLPVDAVLKKAKEYNLTLTEFLAGVYCYVLYKTQLDENPRRLRPVKISIPVNMRKYYNTPTLRNYAFYVNPGIDPNYGEYTLEEIFHEIHHFMRQELSPKYLNAKIYKNVSSERNFATRLAPLFIKNIIMAMVYRYVGDSRFTSTLSNLGAVEVPDEMAPHVEKFDFILGPSLTNNVNCAVVSYKNKLVINFTRKIKESYVERDFFRFLIKMGIPVFIESNQL